MLHAIMIFIGLSLDNYVVMMHAGARIKDQNALKFTRDSLIFALINAATYFAGYLISRTIDPVVADGVMQLLCASLVVLCNGLILLTRGFFKVRDEERLNRNWNVKGLCRLALVSSIDTLFISVGFGLLGVPMIYGLIMSFGITFLACMSGLNVGYRYGSEYERYISMAGGALAIVFGFWMMHTVLFVLLK